MERSTLVMAGCLLLAGGIAYSGLPAAEEEPLTPLTPVAMASPERATPSPGPASTVTPPPVRTATAIRVSLPTLRRIAEVASAPAATSTPTASPVSPSASETPVPPPAPPDEAAGPGTLAD